MLWLDHLIFGNGYGVRSPFWDDHFYWLAGRLYTWIGGFGAQLESHQWFHPKPGERRKLCGREFHPFMSRRRWLRVSVSWAMTLPENIDDANAALRKLRSELGNV